MDPEAIKYIPTLCFLDLPFTSSCACRPSAQVAKHRQSAPVILSNKWMVGQSSTAKTRSHFAFHMAPKAPNQPKSYHKTATIRRTQGMPLGPPAYPSQTCWTPSRSLPPRVSCSGHEPIRLSAPPSSTASSRMSLSRRRAPWLAQRMAARPRSTPPTSTTSTPFDGPL